MKPRRVLITGVSRGLGRALVDELTRHGHVVAGCARDAKAIDELRAQHSQLHVFERVDVADATQVERWAKRLVPAWGVPELLVNNAGVINRTAPLWELAADELEQVLAVNVAGTGHVLRAFLPAMIEHGHGVVVNMSSGWGRSTAPGEAPYCASKYAIEGLTGALAQELPKGLAAVSLNPGVIDTEMLRVCFGDAAGGHEGPQAWARRAAPMLLGLGPADNGAQLTV